MNTPALAWAGVVGFGVVAWIVSIVRGIVLARRAHAGRVARQGELVVGPWRAIPNRQARRSQAGENYFLQPSRLGKRP